MPLLFHRISSSWLDASLKTLNLFRYDVRLSVLRLVEHPIGLVVAEDLLGGRVEAHRPAHLPGSSGQQAQDHRLVALFDVGVQQAVVAAADRRDPVLEVGQIGHRMALFGLAWPRLALGPEETVVARVVGEDL